jgi:hypothetical protein
MGHTSRRICIEFDAAIDMQIGFIIYLRSQDNPVVDKKFVNLSLNTLRNIRAKDKDFLRMAFYKKFDYKTTYGIYQDMLTSDYDEITKCAPNVVCTERIINIFNAQDNKGIAICELLASNPKEFAILKNHYPNSIIIDRSGKPDLDFERYARIIIGDINNCEKYIGTKFKHITVLSYPQNFELIDGIRMIKKEALVILGQTNQFELIDPF